MPKVMSDSTADKLLFYAFFAWAASCVHPVIGLLLQFPVIIYLVKRCDIKGLPALLILMLGKSTFRFFAAQGVFAIRLGITLTPGALFSISAFIFAMICLINSKYDQGAMMFSYIWLLSAIPAFIISFQAKSYGLVGAWSAPVMAFLVPGVYYWGLSMAKTYESGRDYMVKRLLVILLFLEILNLIGIFYVFSFFHSTLLVCLALYIAKDKTKKWGALNAVAVFSIFVALATMLFARRLQMEAAIATDYNAADISSADKLGSTFSSMANMLFALAMVIFGKQLSRGILRFLPILIVIINVSFVSFVIITKSGNKANDVGFKYENLSERIQSKLFFDRGTVWTMGWEEIKTPPYIFKDMRQTYEYKPNGMAGAKLLPHNQFITLLARDGLWLGGVLSFFIIWVWTRAFKAMTFCRDDLLICMVFIPVGVAIYFILGITGQCVVTAELWANSLVCLIFPAIVYGHWLQRQRQSMVGMWGRW